MCNSGKKQMNKKKDGLKRALHFGFKNQAELQGTHNSQNNLEKVVHS